MTIEHIAQFTSSIGTTTVPAAGFGTPLIAGYHTNFAGLAKRYTGDPNSILQALTTDGFSTADAIYRMANKLLSQEFAPREIKVGRLQNAPVQSLALTPGNTVEGSVYALTFGNDQGTETATITVQSGDAAADVAGDIETAVNAFATLTDLSASAVGDTVTITSGTDEPFSMEWAVNSLRRPADLDILDGSTAASIASDLTDIETEDPDWYALLLAVESAAISEAVGDWIATRKKVYLALTSDSDATESGTSTDIGSVMQSDANNRVACFFEPNYRDYSNCAWAGTMLPRAPGSNTWALKSLTAVAASSLPDSLFTNLNAKDYTTLRAINRTQSATYGGFVSGNYLYLNILRSFDWLEARAEEAIANLLLSNGKIPFTAEGLALVKQALERVVADAVSIQVLAPGDPDNESEDPTPKVLIPRIGETGADASARASRTLSNVKITGRFAGAIHMVVGDITVTF